MFLVEKRRIVGKCPVKNRLCSFLFFLKLYTDPKFQKEVPSFFTEIKYHSKKNRTHWLNLMMSESSSIKIEGSKIEKNDDNKFWNVIDTKITTIQAIFKLDLKIYGFFTLVFKYILSTVLQTFTLGNLFLKTVLFVIQSINLIFFQFPSST
jgi:hypothetical protein